MTEAKKLGLCAASGSDIGQVRANNEDAVFSWVADAAAPATGLLILADGMGGHQAGDVASHLAVDTISETWVPFLKQAQADSQTPQQLEERVRRSIQEANQTIYHHAQQKLAPGATMGTTVVCVLLRGELGIVANVGDSRVYLLGASGLQLLTRDHTRVWELVELGQLDPESAAHHPHRNVLTRSLGVGSEVKVDVRAVSLQKGQRLLLCSDGLWGMIPDPNDLGQMLAQAATPQKAVERLIREANARGGEDNIGVVVCEVSEG
jgi:serine/threonine protein phosphatase PrpC